MNIVNAGDSYMVYGEDVKTFKVLPSHTYTINFNKMTGYSLIKSEDMEITEKVYGSYQRKIDKILNTFSIMNRNMGVILSGPKGVGKTMFSKLLARKAMETNMPLILVDEPTPGLHDFISSIKQECIVLFDEFEKNFYAKDSSDNSSPQTNLLSLFDGLDTGKKLFIITCNEVHRLNQYFIDRPGRFYYHFTFSNPTPDEVKEYMEDKLTPEVCKKYLDEIVGLAEIGEFTYDVLRAIAFELNQGYPLNETLEDLNIRTQRNLSLKFKMVLENGKVLFASCIVDMLDDQEFLRFHTVDYKDEARFFFNPGNLRIKNGAYYLAPENMVLATSLRSLEDCEDEDDKLQFEFEKNLKIRNLYITKDNFREREQKRLVWKPLAEEI